MPTSPTTSDLGTVFSINYDFHAGNGDNGNVFAIINNRDNMRTQAFTYDTLNRLITSQNAGTDCTQTTATGGTEYWGNSYAYDAWGNLLEKQITKCSAESLSVSADNNNRIHTGAAPDYAYDAAGNMTYDATTGNTYTYDPENRIMGAGGFTYTYDADGNRVEKSMAGAGTIYWYMTPGIIMESDLSGNLKSEYLFFDELRVARRDFPSAAVWYYFSDHLKTASVITDPSGNLATDEDYYPWGGELQMVNKDSNHYKFTGKERDGESGLDLMGFRHYGNWFGRFTSSDLLFVTPARALDPQQLNLYSYSRNNPARFTDPTGLTIDDSQLNDKNRKKFQHIRDIANQKDKNGNYAHPHLQEALRALDNDSRTFVIQNTSFGDNSAVAGHFTITDYTADGKDFTRALVQLDIRKIEGLSGAHDADLVPGFKQYGGLFDVKDEKGLRLAELFGHEGGGHGVYAIQNPEEAVAAQQAENAANNALASFGKKLPSVLPPDLMQKLLKSDALSRPSERFAQQVERAINRELQPAK